MLRAQRWFLPKNYYSLSTTQQIQAKFLAVNTSSTLLWGPGMMTLIYFLDSPITTFIVLYGFIVSMTSAFILKFKGEVRVAATVFVVGLYFMFVAATLSNNGANFGGLVWMMILPLLALNALGLKASVYALLGCLILLLGLKAAPYLGFEIPNETSVENHQLFQYLSLLIVMPILWAIGTAYYGLSRSAIKKEKELNETKTRFISNVSHELRTPLNGIIGNIELLKEEISSENAKNDLDKVEYSAKHLLELVNDILTLTESEFKKEEISKSPYRFKDNIERLVNNLRPLAEKKSLVLNYKANSQIPSVLIGNSKKVDQLMINFIGNAIKFTHKGHVDIDVNYEELDDSKVKIIVDIRDTGIGISDADLDRLFDAFYQVDDASTREFGGSGLGLAISRQIIESMDGEIVVASELGRGSHFQFSFQQSLPTSKVSVLSMDSDQQIQSDIEKHLHFVEIVPNEKQLLIVEDNEINQMVLKRMLESKGYNTSVASNGKEAIEEVSNNRYDLIFMDGHMPVLDGYKATAHIRTELKITTPIIAVTAGVTQDDREKCLESGMNEILAKPFMSKDVYKVTERWLKKAQTEQEASQ